MSWIQRLTFAAAVVVVTAFARAQAAPDPAQTRFNSPQEAVTALLRAVEASDSASIGAIFGPLYVAEAERIDDATERANRARIVEMANQVKRIEERSADEAVLLLGAELWPFPAPMIRDGSSWVFDTKTGIDEIYKRRIGENELSAIEVCRAYVDAQREYAAEDHDGDGVLEYAQALVSQAGQKNGLYWPVDEASGEPLSPFGPLLASADAAQAKAAGHYNGYRFKVLTSQDKNAPGGKFSYLEDDNMVYGFAIVAWPAEYGSSGVMTFTVNHHGAVYEKDLGKKTASTAEKMKRFNPDDTWGFVGAE